MAKVLPSKIAEKDRIRTYQTGTFTLGTIPVLSKQFKATGCRIFKNKHSKLFD